MTNEQLDAKYSQLTGLRFKVSEVIAEAGENSQKLKAAYDHLMWHIKNGQIRQVDGIKELVEEVIPALAAACGQQSSAEPSEQEIYTAAEAIAYNATLQGAVKAGDVQTPAVEEVEGVKYTQEEIDAAAIIAAKTTDDWKVEPVEGVHWTENEIEQAEPQDPQYGKTTDDWKVEPVEGVKYTQEEINAASIVATKTTDDWKVEPIEAQDEVLYTEETAAAYNATLTGAVKAGDPKPNA